MSIKSTKPTFSYSESNELFADYWKKVNGNNEAGQESNMQKIYQALSDIIDDLEDLDVRSPFVVKATDVTNLSFNDNTDTLSWTAASTADQEGTVTITYKVYLDGNLVTTTSNTSYTFTGLSGNTHTFKVQTVFNVVFTPSGTDTSTGATITQPNTVKLSSPTAVLTISGGVGTITIGSVSNASSYKVRIYKGSNLDATKTGLSSGTSTLDYSFAAGYTYTIYVSAIGDGTYYLDSDETSESVTYNITTLQAPTISNIEFDDAYVDLTLSSVTGAESYVVTIKDSSNNIVANATYSTSGNKQIAGTFTGGETYTFEAYCTTTNVDYTSPSSTTTQTATYSSGSGSNAVSFATDSWDVIAAEAERISNYYEINGSIPSDTPYGIYDPENSDTNNVRTIQLSTNENIEVCIIGFCHDTLASAYSGGGTKAGITLGMVDSLATTAMMNSNGSNSGGWGSSEMRTAMATYLAQLPQAVQDVITPVVKSTSAGSQSSTINTSTDSLFLLSHIEVFGTIYQKSGTQYSFSGEGTQYAYYANAPLIKDTGNTTWTALAGTKGTCTSTGTAYLNSKGESKTASSGRYVNFRNAKANGYQGATASAWWLRSPHSSGSGSFCRVISAGSVYSYYANNTAGVSFGFCI